MTKNDLAERVASKTGMCGSQARQAVEAAIETVSDELASGGEVALAGFGKFSVSQRAARQGRNPSTGATIHIAASKAAKFSAAAREEAAEPLEKKTRVSPVRPSR